MLIDEAAGLDEPLEDAWVFVGAFDLKDGRDDVDGLLLCLSGNDDLGEDVFVGEGADSEW